VTYDLPIFPLRLVLFPGAVAPLHIFEERYRTMLDDCLGADRVFGISYSRAGAPPVGSTGCRARIRDVERLADGRSNIVVSGENRYRIVEWRDQGTPYLVARVEPIDDVPEPESSLADLTGAVRKEYHRLARLLVQVAGAAPPDVPLADDPQALSFQISAALDADDDTKQALLAETSTAARLRYVIQLLRQARSGMLANATMQTELRKNGKGQHAPEFDDFP
jgi:Lon protease-like protein